MRALGGPPGGPKGPKMASGWPPRGSISAIFGPLGPPSGPPGVLILIYHFTLPPLDRISVKTANIFYQSKFDERKIEKIQGFGQFWPFLDLLGPLVGPPGLFILSLSFFSTLSASNQCKNNKSYLPE